MIIVEYSQKKKKKKVLDFVDLTNIHTLIFQIAEVYDVVSFVLHSANKLLDECARWHFPHDSVGNWELS